MIKKLIPKKVLNLRHLFFAWLGSVIYRWPSNKIYIIGVTGTSGKSSVVYFLRQLLENSGYKVGALSTIEFCVAGECELNDKKMTMLGKMAIQKYLRKMVKANCDIAIIETTSEGRVQHRHRFINYDMIVLTNLYEEHIESHGSFEAYKQAKLDIFEYVSKCKRKIINGKKISKTAIVNSESEYKQEFFQPEAHPANSAGRQPFEPKDSSVPLAEAGNFNFDDRLTFGLGGEFCAINVSASKNGLTFNIGSREFRANLFGQYNVSNISAVIAIARSLDIEWDKIVKAVNNFTGVPGRIEFIEEAVKYGIEVIVDYAFEPVAMAELYKVVDILKPRKILHVFGSTGGGRDISRRQKLGEFIGKKADICIITDEDPYDDDPLEIIDNVAEVVAKVGKKEGSTYFKISDRGEAIKKAIILSQPGDIVLVTGKGSEQAIVVKGKLLPWDDREAVRDALKCKL